MAIRYITEHPSGRDWKLDVYHNDALQQGTKPADMYPSVQGDLKYQQIGAAVVPMPEREAEGVTV